MAGSQTKESTWRKEQLQASPEAQGRTGWSGRRMAVLGVVAAVVLLWLILYLTVGGDFYRTVEEVKAAGTAESVRVGGLVKAGTVEQDGETIVFALEGESGELLEVRYVGRMPEGLGAYEQVVAEGSLADSGQFEATALLVKCPDKLLPEKITNRVLEGAGLERVLY
ncbi:MAG: hypothetical protein Kow00129_17000 [Thermoleophilia bacterium]